MNKKIFDDNVNQQIELLKKASSFPEKELMKDENLYTIVISKKLARELALAHSSCKCLHCKTEDRLSFHHKISKSKKKVMEFGDWLYKRTIWNNLLVLCWPCHYKEHDRNPEFTHEKESNISNKMITKVKRKYGIR